MAGGAVVLFAINGLGRATFGLEQARSSRYVYIAAALLLPLLVCGLQALMATGSAAAVAWGFLTWAIIGNVGAYFVQREYRLDLLAATRPRIEAAAAYADRSWVDPDFRPEPTYDPDVTMASLRSLMQGDELDRPERVPADAALRAALDFGVAIEPSSTATPTDGLTVIGVTDAVTSPTGEACTTVTATGPSPAVMLAGGDSGAVQVQTIGTGLAVRMVDDARREHRAASHRGSGSPHPCRRRRRQPGPRPARRRVHDDLRGHVPVADPSRQAHLVSGEGQAPAAAGPIETPRKAL